MLLPIARAGARVVTKSALALVNEQACSLVNDVRTGHITFADAVKMLEDTSPYRQLIQDHGLQLARYILANSLSMWRAHEHR